MTEADQAQAGNPKGKRWPREACDNCGKLISTNPGPRTHHRSRCSPSPPKPTRNMPVLRTALGHFLPGQGSPNPGGRPKLLDRAHAYLDVAWQKVPPDRFARIVERAAKDAEKGDPIARQWITDALGLKRLLSEKDAEGGTAPPTTIRVEIVRPDAPEVVVDSPRLLAGPAPAPGGDPSLPG